MKGRGANRAVPERLPSGHRGCDSGWGGYWRLEMRLGLGLGYGNAFGGERRPECLGGSPPSPPPPLLQAIPWGRGPDASGLGAKNIAGGGVGTHFQPPPPHPPLWETDACARLCAGEQKKKEDVPRPMQRQKRSSVACHRPQAAFTRWQMGDTCPQYPRSNVLQGSRTCRQIPEQGFICQTAPPPPPPLPSGLKREAAQKDLGGAQNWGPGLTPTDITSKRSPRRIVLRCVSRGKEFGKFSVRTALRPRCRSHQRTVVIEGPQIPPPRQGKPFSHLPGLSLHQGRGGGHKHCWPKAPGQPGGGGRQSPLASPPPPPALPKRAQLTGPPKS